MDHQDEPLSVTVMRKVSCPPYCTECPGVRVRVSCLVRVRVSCQCSKVSCPPYYSNTLTATLLHLTTPPTPPTLSEPALLTLLTMPYARPRPSPARRCSPTVAASITYGCSLRYIRLQASALPGAALLAGVLSRWAPVIPGART